MTASDDPAGFIIDTNIISNRGDRDHPHVAEWLQRYAALLRVSVITVAEMRRGLALMEQKIASITDRNVKAREQARVARKAAWYREITDLFEDRIIPIDVAVAHRWAEISVRFPSLRDGDKVILAAALAKGHGVATRNIGDFRAGGVPLMNPFDPDTWFGDFDDDPVRRLF